MTGSNKKWQHVWTSPTAGLSVQHWQLKPKMQDTENQRDMRVRDQIKDLRREQGWSSDLFTKIVLRLAHPHTHSRSLPLFIPLLPPLLPISRVPLVLVSLLSPVLPLVASIVESLDTSSRIAHTQSKIKPISNRTLGTPTKEREIRLILQRARTSRKQDKFIIPRWLQHRRVSQ